MITQLALRNKGARFHRSGDDAARKALCLILNSAPSAHRMEEAETIHDRPALAGVIQDIEANPDIAALLQKPRRESLPFRQLVGIAVLLKMESMRWQKIEGRKGRLSQSRYFTLSQRYAPSV